MTTFARTTQVIRESLNRILGHDAHDWAVRIAADLQDAGLDNPRPQIIRTRAELTALDPDTLVQPPQNEGGEWPRAISAKSLQWAMRTWNCTLLPAVVIATGEQARAARQALGEA